VTASRREEAAIYCLLAATFSAGTVLSLADGLEIAQDEGGIARSAALGLLLLTVALLSAGRRSSEDHPAGSPQVEPPSMR
jgi:hypothetical protein